MKARLYCKFNSKNVYFFCNDNIYKIIYPEYTDVIEITGPFTDYFRSLYYVNYQCIRTIKQFFDITYYNALLDDIVTSPFNWKTLIKLDFPERIYNSFMDFNQLVNGICMSSTTISIDLLLAERIVQVVSTKVSPIRYNHVINKNMVSKMLIWKSLIIDKSNNLFGGETRMINTVLTMCDPFDILPKDVMYHILIPMMKLPPYKLK